MAHNVDSRAKSPGDVLRASLDAVDRMVVTVDASNVETLLLTLDTVDSEFERLADSGIDLRPELGRWEAMIKKVNNRAPAIASAASKGPGYGKLRRTHAIGDKEDFSFWWFLDHEANRRQRKLITRMLTTLGIMAGVLVGGYWLMQTFFPPDPMDVLYSDVMYRTDQAVMEQNWEQAMIALDAHSIELSTEPDLYVWRGVIAEKLGDQELAESSLAQAKVLLADQEVVYWNTVGNRRLQVGELDQAEVALRQALALDPESPQAYFLLGGISEAREDYAQAIEYFNLTFELAEANDPPTGCHRPGSGGATSATARRPAHRDTARTTTARTVIYMPLSSDLKKPISFDFAATIA